MQQGQCKMKQRWRVYWLYWSSRALLTTDKFETRLDEDIYRGIGYSSSWMVDKIYHVGPADQAGRPPKYNKEFPITTQYNCFQISKTRNYSGKKLKWVGWSSF